MTLSDGRSTSGGGLSNSMLCISNGWTETSHHSCCKFPYPQIVQYLLSKIQFKVIKTLPKAQRTRGLSSSYQSNFLRSCHEFLHRACSNFIFRIMIKNKAKCLFRLFALSSRLWSSGSGKISKLKVGQYFASDVWLRLRSWILVNIPNVQLWMKHPTLPSHFRKFQVWMKLL